MSDNMDEPSEDYVLADYVNDVHTLVERALTALTTMGIKIQDKDKAALIRLKRTSLDDLADGDYLKISKDLLKKAELVDSLEKRIKVMAHVHGVAIDALGDLESQMASTREDLEHEFQKEPGHVLDKFEDDEP